MSVNIDLDIYSYKQARLLRCVKGVKGNRRVGLPLQLQMYEQLPLWATFFESLGCEVALSGQSPRVARFGVSDAVVNGACYPVKFAHGHIESLLNAGVDFIFMPCGSYDSDGHRSINGCDCPVSAYYPELLKVCNDGLTDDNFIAPYIDIALREDAAIKLYAALKSFGVKKRDVKKALAAGFEELDAYRKDVRNRAAEIFACAEREGRRIAMLASRPCRFSVEIERGVSRLLGSLGFAVLSADVAINSDAPNRFVYDIEPYLAADFAAKRENISFIQLSSRGCGLDEMTSDGARAILEKSGKPYALLSLDETSDSDELKRLLAACLPPSEFKANARRRKT